MSRSRFSLLLSTAVLAATSFTCPAAVADETKVVFCGSNRADTLDALDFSHSRWTLDELAYLPRAMPLPATKFVMTAETRKDAEQETERAMTANGEVLEGVKTVSWPAKLRARHQRGL